jgi:hypothetical protein
MNRSRILPVLLLLLAIARAAAVDYDVFRATVSIPFVNSIFVNDTDIFVNTRVGNKEIINLALFQPFKTKVSPDLVVALLVPKGGSPFTSPRLVVFNKKTNFVVATVATFASSNVLAPDDPTKPGVGIVAANFSAMTNTDFNTQAFSLTSSGTALARPALNGPLLTFSFPRFHGTFSRSGFSPSYYASIVTGASVRATGKPIATVSQ